MGLVQAVWQLYICGVVIELVCQASSFSRANARKLVLQTSRIFYRSVLCFTGIGGAL